MPCFKLEAEGIYDDTRDCATPQSQRMFGREL